MKIVLLILCALFFTPAFASNFTIEQTKANPNPTLEDRIASYIFNCWRLPPPITPTDKRYVRVNVALDGQGNIVNIALTPQSARDFAADPVFKKIAMDAMVALKICNPIPNLPLAEYEKWKQMELQFDTTTMMDRELPPEQ